LSHFISILLLGSERFRRREIGAHKFFSWVPAEKSGTLLLMGCLQNSLLKQYWLYFVWSQILATRLPKSATHRLGWHWNSNAYAIRGHCQNIIVDSASVL
jgi:hypothetical protein